MYFVGKIFKFILKYSVAALLQHTTHAKLKKEIVEHENFTNATRKPLLNQNHFSQHGFQNGENNRPYCVYTFMLV
jgi:hypothetical protein